MPDQPRGVGQEVTLGEVYRAVMEIRQEQRDMRRDLIGRAEYESDQESIERQLTELTKALADERMARESGDQRIITTAEQGKRWAIGIAMTGGVALLTLIGFVLDLGVGAS